MSVGKARSQARGPGYRWTVFSRVIAGLCGGYALGALGTAVLSLWLPSLFGMGRADAVLAATLASFLWYTMAVVWVFAARSALRAWAGVAMAGLVLGMLLLGAA